MEKKGSCGIDDADVVDGIETNLTVVLLADGVEVTVSGEEAKCIVGAGKS